MFLKRHLLQICVLIHIVFVILLAFRWALYNIFTFSCWPVKLYINTWQMWIEDHFTEFLVNSLTLNNIKGHILQQLSFFNPWKCYYPFIIWFYNPMLITVYLATTPIVICYGIAQCKLYLLYCIVTHINYYFNINSYWPKSTYETWEPSLSRNNILLIYCIKM